MRIESSVTSVSWIPSEVVSGLPKAAFAAGALHYDDPPPDVLGDVGELYAAEKFRFANRLAASVSALIGARPWMSVRAYGLRPSALASACVRARAWS